MNQISIFEWTDSMKPKSEPLLSIEQTVHEVNLDVVRTGTVENIWECGKDRHGYSLLLDTGYTTIWDENIGKNAFTDMAEAIRLADETAKNLAVIRKEDIVPTSQKSWRYSRDDCTLAHGKPYVVYATIAMVGDKTVYVEDFMTYPFYYICGTEKEAEKLYKERLKKIASEVERYPESHIETSEQIQFRDMYRVSKTLYSAWDYAMRHGEPFLDNLKN